jgi:RiboL-PSP-HEPN
VISARADVSEKRQEAQVLLDLVTELCGRPDSVVRTAIMKSAHMLLLYNAIESSVTNVLEQVHDTLGREKYSDLRPEIRRLWTEYFFQRHAEKTRFDHLEATVRGDAKFPRLSDFLDHVNLFSGNLDGRAISELLTKYGIGALTTPDRAKLLDIKSKRNKIAHGEEMFKEACRNFTVSDMEGYQTACFNALESILDQADIYLKEMRYKSKP